MGKLRNGRKDGITNGQDGRGLPRDLVRLSRADPFRGRLLRSKGNKPMSASIAARYLPLKRLLALFPLLLLSACITSQKDILYLNDQIISLNDRMAKLEKSQQDLNAKLPDEPNVQKSLESIRLLQAETGDQMDKIRLEMQNLLGRVQENSALVNRAVERDTTEQDAMKASLADLNERLAYLETSMERVYKHLKLKPPKGPESIRKDQEEVIEEKTVSEEKQLYDRNLDFYRQGKYADAISGFNDFLKKYPNSELADNAQFWIGGSFMALKEYKQAILAYQKVIEQYPKGNKVPGAMLLQATAFAELQDNTSATLLLKKILREYPDSSEAKIAESKLKRLQ